MAWRQARQDRDIVFFARNGEETDKRRCIVIVFCSLNGGETNKTKCKVIVFCTLNIGETQDKT
jgi:hypothetical protein